MRAVVTLHRFFVRSPMVSPERSAFAQQRSQRAVAFMSTLEQHGCKASRLSQGEAQAF